ncbi:MAG: dihydrofolate reductase [Burkholderiaceae bacterium]|nr:dihydrofolate reductase [Burkholderiaceae bacterium]
MGKLVMSNLVTLDGYFEGAQPWDLAWHARAADDVFMRHMLEQLRTAEMLVFGRVTYEGMAKFWPTVSGENEDDSACAELMNSLPKVVFSRTLTSAEWNNTTVMRDDACAAVAELKRKTPGNILISGSAELSHALTEAGLFDEYRIAVVSTVLGSGRPLFRTGMDALQLKLIDTWQLNPACTVLRYVPA